LYGAAQRVADGPETLLELIALVVCGQSQECLALFIGDDIDHVLVDPLFVLSGELGFLGGCGKVEAEE